MNSIIDCEQHRHEMRMEKREWRSRDRVKTSASVISLCLHLGIDPPDVIRPVPGTESIAGITLPDSLTASPGDQRQAAEAIGNAIQGQFEYWQPRGHYKTLIDPPIEELRKVCLAARKSAKEERVLFYYNGWGVPKPTRNGELWVFNTSYTQYLPLSLNELDSWLPGPLVVILDCPNSAFLLTQWQKIRNGGNFYGFAASSDQIPNIPGFPGDLFTACLTSPLKVALKTAGKEIPGKLNDRNTPLGQLHWVFTAITDTIGWQQHSPLIFKELYRQDVLLASLFRNFLLAQRVMRMYGANPTSVPSVPLEGNDLWTLWDCVVDRFASKSESQNADVELDDFFGDHLEAFERYLSTNRKFGDERKYLFLPIVLQMLLSQQHRVRALEGLVTFMDQQGVWQCLDVGVYPYLLKLLHSGEEDSREALSQIWLRLLLADGNTADDLKPQVIASFFIPRHRDGKETENESVFLACLYLIEQQLGTLGLLEELTPNDSPWYAILANKPHSDVWLRIHTNSYEEDFEGIYDKDPLLRRYLARSLFHKSLNSTKWLKILEDLAVNDPWPIVREEASKLAAAVNKRLDESRHIDAATSGGVQSLAQKMERTRLEEETEIEVLEPIPMHMIRTRLLPSGSGGRSSKPIVFPSDIPDEPTLGKKLYEQIQLPTGENLEKIVFDKRLTNVLLLLYKGGRVDGFNYDTRLIIFSLSSSSQIHTSVEDVEALENGFIIQTGNVFYEYYYDLPLTLISTPNQIQVTLKSAWRTAHPVDHPMSIKSCDEIRASIEQNKVILQREEAEVTLAIPSGETRRSGFFWNKTPADSANIKSIAWHPTASLLAVCTDTAIVYLFH